MNDPSASTTPQGTRFLDEIAPAVAALEREQVEERAALERDLDAEMRGRRSMEDLAIDWLHSGSMLRVTAGGQDWKGSLTHVGREMMRLCSRDSGEVDIVFTGVTNIEVAPARVCRRGRPLRYRHPATLVARLRELVVDESPVTVGTVGGDATHGAVVAVAPEHVEVEAKRGLAVLPLRVIAWVAEGGPEAVRS